jgi:hypothetical protein
VADPKLVVTATKGGSKITLIGSSGTPLLSSKVFSEPRGKGATLRALKGLLGEGIAVDDQTLPARQTEPTAVTTRRRATSTRTRKPATSTAKKTRKRAVAARTASKTSRAVNASRSRRRVVKRAARA